MRKKKEILKIKLEKVYSPPTPERKGEFLQNLSYPQISFWEFLRIQAFFLRSTSICGGASGRRSFKINTFRNAGIGIKRKVPYGTGYAGKAVSLIRGGNPPDSWRMYFYFMEFHGWYASLHFLFNGSHAF